LTLNLIILSRVEIFFFSIKCNKEEGEQID